MAGLEAFAAQRGLAAKIKEQHGSMVGIACKQGRFAVTETRKEGRRWATEALTSYQSYAECVEYMRALAGERAP